MSSIIKSNALERSGSSVQPFAFSVAAPLSDEASHESLLEARIAELEAELATTAEQHAEELEVACAEAAREALEQRSDAEDQALGALAAALTDAQTAWQERLVSWETAACGIAKTALEQIVGQASDHASLVEAAIARQLERLETATVIRIRVNADDFAEEEAISRLRTGLGIALDVVTDATLPPGGCVFDLTLGHMDVGPGAQWGRLAKLLDRLEREGLDP